MSKKEKIRAHFILPEGKSQEIEADFKERFHSCGQQYADAFGQSEENEVLSTSIIEDRRDHRNHISEIRELLSEAFPRADVMMTEQYSPRNRQEQAFLDYSHDVIVQVSNEGSPSPSVKQRIELSIPSVGGAKHYENKYVVYSKKREREILSIDLERGVVDWQRKAKYQEPNGIIPFDAGIVQSSRSDPDSLCLYSWQDGRELWALDGISGNSRFKSFGHTVSEGLLYMGTTDGDIFEINIAEGKVQEIYSIDQKIRFLEYEDESLYIGSTRRRSPPDNTDSTSPQAGENYTVRRVDVASTDVVWRVGIENSGRYALRPDIDGEILVTNISDHMKIYDTNSAKLLWSVRSDDVADIVDSATSDKPTKAESLSDKLSNFYNKTSISKVNVVENSIYAVGQTKKGPYLINFDGVSKQVNWKFDEHSTGSYDFEGYNRDSATIMLRKKKDEFTGCLIAVDLNNGSQTWEFGTPGLISGSALTPSGAVFLTSEECILFRNPSAA